MTRKREVKFFVQLEPRWSSYTNPQGEYYLTKVSATSITSKRSTRRMPNGAIEVEMKLSIPEQAFYPLRPQVVIDIPASVAADGLIEAEVVEA